MGNGTNQPEITYQASHLSAVLFPDISGTGGLLFFWKNRKMAYRNLTSEQFQVIKDAAAKVCDQKGLKAIGEYKRVANIIIDKIEAGELTYADLLQPEIDITISKDQLVI